LLVVGGVRPDTDLAAGANLGMRDAIAVDRACGPAFRACWPRATAPRRAVRIRVGRPIGSAALVADGLHARTDRFTSLAVAIGWRAADRSSAGHHRGHPRHAALGGPSGRRPAHDAVGRP
jgi:hypothetical protein